MKAESLIGSLIWRVVGTNEVITAVEEPILRKRAATDPVIVKAVAQLNSCIKYADPKVFVNDDIKPGENIFSLLFRK
jgi:hypothetical protein